MGYSIETISPAPHEPITLEQIKRHVRIDDPDHDETLRSLATAARLVVESETSRTLAPTVLAYAFDRMDSSGDIHLPFTPAFEVVSFTVNGEEQEDYELLPSGIIRAPNIRFSKHYRIEYRAGYAARFEASEGWIFPAKIRTRPRLGQEIQVSGPDLPAELSDTTVYYVVEVAANAFRVGLAPGDDPLSITDSDGDHWITDTPEPARLAALMLAGHWFEHPEAMGQLSELPFAISRLIEMLRPGDDFQWRG